jgi:hypothetical protein
MIGFCGEGFFEGIVRIAAGGRKAARSKRRWVGVQRQEKGVGHNEHVSNVYITSLTEYPKKEKAELNDPCLSILISQQPPVTVRVVIKGMSCESQRHICDHQQHIEMTVGYGRFPNNL